jgi:hypothetical protein
LWYYSPKISDCKIHDNEVNWYGGGLSLCGSNYTISNCKIYHNQAKFSEGGGLFFTGAAPKISYCNIKDNIPDNIAPKDSGTANEDRDIIPKTNINIINNPSNYVEIKGDNNKVSIENNNSNLLNTGPVEGDSLKGFKLKR